MKQGQAGFFAFVALTLLASATTVHAVPMGASSAQQQTLAAYAQAIDVAANHDFGQVRTWLDARDSALPPPVTLAAGSNPYEAPRLQVTAEDWEPHLQWLASDGRFYRAPLSLTPASTRPSPLAGQAVEPAQNALLDRIATSDAVVEDPFVGLPDAARLLFGIVSAYQHLPTNVQGTPGALGAQLGLTIPQDTRTFIADTLGTVTIRRAPQGAIAFSFVYNGAEHSYWCSRTTLDSGAVCSAVDYARSDMEDLGQPTILQESGEYTVLSLTLATL